MNVKTCFLIWMVLAMATFELVMPDKGGPGLPCYKSDYAALLADIVFYQETGNISLCYIRRRKLIQKEGYPHLVYDALFEPEAELCCSCRPGTGCQCFCVADGYGSGGFIKK